MLALVASIYVLTMVRNSEDVDGRHKPDHDEERSLVRCDNGEFQSRSSSLMPVLARVCASTVLTMTAQ